MCVSITYNTPTNFKSIMCLSIIDSGGTQLIFICDLDYYSMNFPTWLVVNFWLNCQNHWEIRFENYSRLTWIFNSLITGIFVRDFKKCTFQTRFTYCFFRCYYTNHDALRGMPRDLTDYQSTPVQVMAWCRQATSHYMSQCWPCRHMTSLGHNVSTWNLFVTQALEFRATRRRRVPDSKVRGANMGPTWVLSAPCGPHVAPRTLLSGVTTIMVPDGCCGPQI